MKKSRQFTMLVLALFAASCLGAGLAHAADKDKKKADDDIHWDTPGSQQDTQASASASAPAQVPTVMGGYSSMDDDFDRIRAEMNRMHQAMLGSMGAGGWGWSGGMGPMPGMSVQTFSTSSMSSDVAETDKEYVITCELPGVDKDAIQIDIDGNMLVVRAVRDSGTDKSGDDNGQKYHYRERSSGTTERRFRVGSGVDPKQIKAQLKNGVLTVHVPKGQSQSVKIPIE